MHRELASGFGQLIVYFIISAAGAIALDRMFQIPREIFRKVLHFILLGSILIVTYAFETWWISVAAVVVFTALVYPILAFAERVSGYSDLLTERKKGEIKRSLVIVFSMFSLLITLCWGILDEKYLVIASVFAWGFGDAAAALVGKKFGKNRIRGRLVDGNKTLEGSMAMFIVSFISVMVVLLLLGPEITSGYFPVAIATAAVTAVVELYSKNGMDTITCPLSAAVIMITLLESWGV